MKAYVHDGNSGAIADVPKPSLGNEQVLVRVRACGLNRADILIAKARAHGIGTGQIVLGMEWSGQVVETGPEAKGVKVGDRIMESGDAAFAEYAVTDYGRLFHIPPAMSFEEAATLPVALSTVHDAIVINGCCKLDSPSLSKARVPALG